MNYSWQGIQTFCGNVDVGCVEETEGTTCYCNENKWVTLTSTKYDEQSGHLLCFQLQHARESQVPGIDRSWRFTRRRWWTGIYCYKSNSLSIFLSICLPGGDGGKESIVIKATVCCLSIFLSSCLPGKDGGQVSIVIKATVCPFVCPIV